MASSRGLKFSAAVDADVMTPVAVESLIPLQEDFIEHFMDQLDLSISFKGETKLSIAVLHYLTSPRCADTLAAISVAADTDLVTAMGWFVESCIKTMWR